MDAPENHDCAAQTSIDKSVWYSIARNIPVDMPGAIANHAKRRAKRLETGTSDRIVPSRMPSL